MSDAVILGALVAASSIVNAVISRRNGRLIENIHLSLNSRLSELVRAEKGLARAEGVEAGRSEERP